MKRLLGQTLAVVSVGVLATALMPACAENDSSMFVRMAIAPPQNRQNGCVYTSDPTQPFLSSGTLDVAILAKDPTYIVELLVGSQLFDRGDQKFTRAEPNRTHVNGAVVRVTDANGGQLSEFTSLTSAFIEPQANNTPGYSPARVQALDAATARKVSAGLAPGSDTLVVANIKVFGTTLGGVDLESGEFQFPIRVCNGCLLSFNGGDDPATPGRDCSLPLPEQSNLPIPCRPGQDEGTLCQYCRDYSDACKGQ